MIRPSTGAEPDAPPSPLMQILAVVLLIVPAAGIALHLWIWLQFDDDALADYIRSIWLKASALMAFVLLVGNWFHYRHTRMKVDIVSRVVTYLWAISMVLLFRRMM
ncbi:MAG: hypothetical protein ISS74_02025 [Planctomycetes bacterium]|nr:hypothetical protein [Planctomycetota bacterium]